MTTNEGFTEEGSLFTYTHVNYEVVITFAGNPYKCKWGREVTSDFSVKGEEMDGTPVYRVDSLRDDSSPWADYVVGNKVYMYDRPGGPRIGFGERVFRVWATSSDGKTTIEKFFHLTIGGMRVVRK